MLALRPVDTAAPAFRPDPITQSEAAAMFRAVLNLFGKWELTDEQAATLLDMPVRSYRRWKAEGPGRISRDGVEHGRIVDAVAARLHQDGAPDAVAVEFRLKILCRPHFIRARAIAARWRQREAIRIDHMRMAIDDGSRA